MSDETDRSRELTPSFLWGAAMHPGCAPPPGPSEEAISSLEIAMVQGRVESLLDGRRVAFTQAERRWLRAAFRAGLLDSESERVEGGRFPVSRKEWPAADLMFELIAPPAKAMRSIIRVQVRDHHPRPIRISAFFHFLDADVWSAVEPFTIDRDGIRDFERRVTASSWVLAVAFLETVTNVAGAAKAVSVHHLHRCARSA